MRKPIDARAVARRSVSSERDYVAWSAITLWALAAIYVWATFSVH